MIHNSEHMQLAIKTLDIGFSSLSSASFQMTSSSISFSYDEPFCGIYFFINVTNFVFKIHESSMTRMTRFFDWDRHVNHYTNLLPWSKRNDCCFVLSLQILTHGPNGIDETCQTFIMNDEDHTLGNALKYFVIRKWVVLLRCWPLHLRSLLCYNWNNMLAVVKVGRNVPELSSGGGGALLNYQREFCSPQTRNSCPMHVWALAYRLHSTAIVGVLVHVMFLSHCVALYLSSSFLLFVNAHRQDFQLLVQRTQNYT